jgi:hypothetical protein
MKVANSSGREYYLQPSANNFFPRWCSTVEPSLVDLDGTAVEAFGDRKKSNYIYLILEGTTYCVWAKDPRNFDFLEETSLRITKRGRSKGKSAKAETTSARAGKSVKFQVGKEEELPSREDLEAVLLHLPQLREQVEARASDPNTAEGLYSEEFSSAVRQVVNAFFRHRFMFPFNYQPWMDEARKLEEKRELLAQADLATWRKLVIVHWRQDYWDYDNAHWESIAANGHLVGLLERLEQIAESLDPTVEPPSSKATKLKSDDEGIDDRPSPEGEEETGPSTKMPRKNQKWTHELRVAMYSRLLAQFGPYSQWGTVAYPSGRKSELEEVLKELAADFSRRANKTFEWTALEQQMKWGITRQGPVKNGGFAYQYILNKAAALETGFLTSSDLSGFVHLTSYRGTTNEDDSEML